MGKGRGGGDENHPPARGGWGWGPGPRGHPPPPHHHRHHPPPHHGRPPPPPFGGPPPPPHDHDHDHFHHHPPPPPYGGGPPPPPFPGGPPPPGGFHDHPPHHGHPPRGGPPPHRPGFFGWMFGPPPPRPPPAEVLVELRVEEFVMGDTPIRCRVTLPPDVRAGQIVRISIQGRQFTLRITPAVRPGQTVLVIAPAPAAGGAAADGSGGKQTAEAAVGGVTGDIDVAAVGAEPVRAVATLSGAVPMAAAVPIDVEPLVLKDKEASVTATSGAEVCPPSEGADVSAAVEADLPVIVAVAIEAQPSVELQAVEYRSTDTPIRHTMIVPEGFVADSVTAVTVGDREFHIRIPGTVQAGDTVTVIVPQL